MQRTLRASGLCAVAAPPSLALQRGLAAKDWGPLQQVQEDSVLAVRAIRLVITVLPIHHQLDGVLHGQLRPGERGLEQYLGLL